MLTPPVPLGDLSAVLARCTGVRVLALRPISLLRPAPWATAFLRAGVHTRAVQHLRLYFRADGADAADVDNNIDWPCLARTLADRARFPALRRVTFDVLGGQDAQPTILSHAQRVLTAVESEGGRVAMRFVLRA